MFLKSYRMASFGWKRRIGEKVSKATSQQFEAEAADEKDAAENEDGNWLQASKRRKETLQEGCKQRSQQLKDEGAQLAENKRCAFEILKKIFFTLCVSALSACMPACQKRASGGCEPPCGCWELDSQTVLLTAELSLQPQNLSSFPSFFS